MKRSSSCCIANTKVDTDLVMHEARASAAMELTYQCSDIPNPAPEGLTTWNMQAYKWKGYKSKQSIGHFHDSLQQVWI